MRKIVFVRPRIGFGLGGAETHAAMLVVKFLECGYKVGVVATQINFPQEILSKLDFYSVKIKAKGSILKYFFFLKKTKEVLKKISYDYIISPFKFPETDLLILCDPLQKFWIEQKSKFFVLEKLKVFSLREKILLNFEKKSIESAKKIITLFKMGKELIFKYYPEAYHKTFVCYRGIDFKKFNLELKKNKMKLRSQFGFSSKDYLILFVGYNPKRKGLSLLLKVIKELPFYVKLIVAGVNGKSEERIVYLGKVRGIEKLYALSDMVVIPTLYDPGAMVTLEALASGTPVITSIYDGTKEFIKEGINGYITNLEKDDLKDKILKAMENKFDPEVCHDSIKHLTWDNYVECLIFQLEKL